MRLFSKAKDGGPESPVTGYFLVEIKSLFSIVLLHFNRGTRESLHNHAFNALTVWLRGSVIEENRYSCRKDWRAGQVKYTPRGLMHRIITPATGVYISAFGKVKARANNNGAWAISFRGPWKNTWHEYTPATERTVTLTHGRKIVSQT